MYHTQIIIIIVYYYRICMEGNYTCYASHIVDDKKEEIFSDTVNVQALPEAPQILDRPDLYISLREGSPILLRVKASGYPSPQFQWVYENRILEGQNRDVLCVSYHRRNAKRIM